MEGILNTLAMTLALLGIVETAELPARAPQTLGEAAKYCLLRGMTLPKPEDSARLGRTLCVRYDRRHEPVRTSLMRGLLKSMLAADRYGRRSAAFAWKWDRVNWARVHTREEYPTLGKEDRDLVLEVFRTVVDPAYREERL